MRIDTKTALKGVVLTNELAVLRGALNSDSPLLDILQVIAEVLESAAAGEDSYVTFGTNRQRTAFIATVGYQGSKEYAAGTSLCSLAESLAAFL